MKTACRRWAVVWVAGLAVCSAGAEEKDWLTIEGDYLVGASVVSGKGHIGEPKVEYDLKPMWAFQLGPFRVSRSRASSLMKAGREELETGVSADFGIFDDWRLSGSLRMDNGRNFAPNSPFGGLPSIPSTLRGRLSTGSALSEFWSWSASLDKDLLGRRGGTRLALGANRRIPVSDSNYFDFGLGGSWGGGTYLQTHYGIGIEAAQRTGRAPYLLNGGWENVRASLQYTYVIDERWVLFGGLDLSRMVSAPSRSPLVGRRTSHQLSAGIAFRGKK